MPVYKVGSLTYDIPEEQKEGFERHYPHAIQRFVTGTGKRYRVPLAKRDKFLKEFPDAKPWEYSMMKKENAAGAGEVPEVNRFEPEKQEKPKRKTLREQVEAGTGFRLGTAPTLTMTTQAAEQEALFPGSQTLGRRIQEAAASGRLDTMLEADEERDIDARFHPRQASGPEDIYSNYTDRFALTRRGRELQSELADVQRGVNQRYADEFLRSDEYRDLTRRYAGQELDEKANEAFARIYGERIGKEMQPYAMAYQDEMMSRYGDRIREDMKQLTKEQVAGDVDKLSASVDKQLGDARNSLNQRGGRFPMNGVMGSAFYSRDPKILHDRQQVGNLEVAQSLLDDSQKIIEEAAKRGQTNFVSGLGRGVRDTAFNPETWSFGLADMRESVYLMNVLDKFDRGENLTDGEQALMDAAVANMATNAYYHSDLGRGYKAGTVTGQSIPFMLEFAINPVSGSGSAIAKSILRYGMKKFGAKMAKRGASRMAARLAGDALAATGLTVSTGAARVGAGTVERMTGDIQLDDTGRRYAGRTGQQSAGEALGKSFASTFLENQSEMVFNAFKGFGPVVWAQAERVLPGGTASLVDDALSGKAWNFYRKLQSSPVLREAARRTQFHGLVGEYMEEVYNNFANIPLGEMTLEEATDLDNNIDTFLGLAPTSVAFGMFGLGGLAHERYRHRRQMQQMFKQMNEEERKKLTRLEELSKEKGNEDIKRFIKETIAATNLTPEEKKAEIAYAYDIAVNNAMDDVEAARRKEVADNHTAAIREGQAVYGEHDPQRMRQTVLRREVAQERLTGMGMDEQRIKELGEMPVEEREGQLSAYTEEMRDAATDYLNALDRETAMNEAMDAAHEAEVQRAQDLIQSVTAPNGTVVLVPMGRYGSQPGQWGVVANGIGADGMPTQSNGAVMVYPLQVENGVPVFSSVDTEHAVTVVPASYTDAMILSPDEAFRGMLQSYQQDASILDGTPVATGATFPIQLDDGTVQDVTVAGQDAAGNWLMQQSGTDKPLAMPDAELQTRKRNAEVAPILQEYAAASQAQDEARREVDAAETLQADGETLQANVQPALGDRLTVNGREATVTTLTPDNVVMQYLTPDGELDISENSVFPLTYNEYARIKNESARTASAGAAATPSAEKAATAEPDYPVDANGDPLFVQMPPEQSIGILLSQMQPDDARDFAADKLAEARKSADKAAKRRAKETSFTKRKAELNAIKQEKEAADREAAYWQQVVDALQTPEPKEKNRSKPSGETSSQPDAQPVSQKDIVEDISARLRPRRKRVRYVKEDEALGQAVHPEEHVLREIATGRVTFLWKDTKGGQGLGAHLGLADSSKERQRMIWALSSDGMIPEVAAEAIHADMPETLQGMATDQDIFNMILNAFAEYGTPSRMMEAAKRLHGMDMEENIPGYEADMERQRLEWEAEQNHMSVQEWLTYQEIIAEEADKYYSTLSDEDINVIFEQTNEQLEYERRRNEEEGARSTEESANDTGGHEVLPRQADNHSARSESQPRPHIEAQADEQGSGVVSEQGNNGSEVAQTIGEKVASAEAEVDQNPTEAQKEAGNYRKGHVRIGEFDVTIENPAGSVRSGVDVGGRPWQTTMRNTYGYIRGTEGVDGDHIDVFLANDMDGWNGRRVFIVDQYNEDGTFDEHKVMLGFNDEAEAQDAYLSNYEKGWSFKRKLVLSSVNLPDFEKWIQSSHRKTKPFAEYRSVKDSETHAMSGFDITPAQYMTKRGKVLDMQLVKFAGPLTKEQQRAARELVKAEKGWYDRDKGGFMMRSEESARKLADVVLGNEEAVSDAQPLSIDDIKSVNDGDVAFTEPKVFATNETQTPAHVWQYSVSVDKQSGRTALKRDDVSGPIPIGDARFTIYADSPQKMLDILRNPKNGMQEVLDAVGVTLENKAKIRALEEEEHKGKNISEQPKNSGMFGLVSDERMEELRKRLKQKVLGQMNMGIDPEVLAIGMELTAGYIDRGIKKFADYAKVMVDDMGDVIRPYLKSFYNGARDLPEVQEAGLADEMTPYDEVRTFDVANFDKEHPNLIATAEMVVQEQKSNKQADIAKARLTNNRNTQRKENKAKEKTVSSQTGQPGLFSETIDNLNSEGNERKTKELSQDDRLQREGDSKERIAGADRYGLLPAQDGNVGSSLHVEQGGVDGDLQGRRDDRRGNSGIQEGESQPETARSRSGLRNDAVASPKNTRNNHSERGVDHAPTSVDARIDANIKAIELSQQLIENGETATPEQMAVLRKFSGWGGLGKAFGDIPTARRLQELLGAEGLEQAIMSANSAYYTPAYVVDTLWDIAEQMGFKGGNILEGSAGIGNILGQMPTHISERSNIHAVEIDGTSGNILSLLYPDAQVDIQGFEQTRIPNGSVDLAITNVPFVTGLRVDDTTGDKDLSKKFHNIHDFCIAKNVRKLREGGIGIFISSNGTLDNSKKLRDWVVNEGNADFVGAFRLNNKTFGGTSVTSDIIVIRKRVNGNVSPHAINVSETSGERTAEYDTGETRKVKGQEVPIVKQLPMDYNRYFIEHPENMAGTMRFAFEEGDTFRPTSKGLYPSKDKDQEKMLADFISSFTDMSQEDAATDRAMNPNNPRNFVQDTSSDGKKLGELYVKDGQLVIASLGGYYPLAVNANKVKGHSKVECFNAYSAIKDALSAVLDYQTNHEGNEGLKPLLGRLNKAYDDFVKTYGHFNKNTAIAFLRNDVDYPNVFSLETYEEAETTPGKRVAKFGKTDIFKKRVVEKEKEPTPTNVKDGIIASIFKYGKIDVPYIAGQLGETTEDVRKEIIDKGYGFENPATRLLEVSFQYLSGNVREKLRLAQEYNENGMYDNNIKALQDVMPMDIPAHLIDFTLGSSWIDPKLYDDYVQERTGIDVHFTSVGGTWYMRAPEYGLNKEKNRAMGVVSEMLHKTIMGHTLIEAAIQNRTITVSQTNKKWDGTTETITDKEATQACAAKIDEIRQDFKDWARQKMQSDAEMSATMERIYNDTFNNFVPMSIPDDFVPEYFGGASHKYQMRPHQGKAIVCGTMQPLLLAHEVGTGKTFALISIAMEMRRLGIATKPMIVVQNATVGQFVASAKGLYPNAKILTLEEADRSAEGRKNFYAKIKYNDWDMIVVPQSTFEFIPDSEERQMSFIQDKIEEKMIVLEQMKEADPDGKSIITKQAEREIEQLQEQLAELTDESSKKRSANDQKKRAVALQNAKVKAREMLDRRTDDVENFDDMGIDALLVDEAHEYKHLGFATAMQRGVKGVDPSYSKKSQGVYLKTQAVLEKSHGKNVIFATGTPISNTAAEIWTFMRYLMPADTMKEYGIYYFDDFVRNFGNIQQMLEFTTSGKFRENNRFAGYVNLPELVRIWSGVADTVLTREAGGVSDKIPEMEGGKAQDLYLPQTRALRSIMKYVKAELERFEKMSGKEKKENSHIPLTMYGIAKAAAVDARLVQADAEDDPNSKTNEAVRQTLRSLKETADYKGTIAIFADNYQNKQSGFNLYEDIRDKLIANGVPAEQIVVMKSGMTVKKKLDIFDKVNRGEVRVILGSTFTLGTGVNIQERLHTLIHLDAPNRPMDYTQRNGRILRQGNLHKEWGKSVRILRFGVEDSLDVTAYQRLKTKGAIADSIMNGKQMMNNSMTNRVLEEDEDVFGDTVAQLSGSEYAMLKNNAEKNVRKYESRKKQWESDQTYIHHAKPKLKGLISEAEKTRKEQNGYLEAVRKTFPDGKFNEITIGKHKFASIDAMDDFIKEYNKGILDAAKKMKEGGANEQTRQISISLGGYTFKVQTILKKEMSSGGGQLFSEVHRNMTYSCPELGLKDVPVYKSLLRNAISDIVDNVITGVDFAERAEAAGRALKHNQAELEQLESREGQPFEFEDELKQARKQYQEYSELMKKEMAEKEAKYAEMDADIKTANNISINEEDDVLYRFDDYTTNETEINLRSGEGTYTDDEISYENDPIGKMLGKQRRSRARRIAFAERERRRMAERVQNLAETLHLDNVEVVTDASTLEGKRAKAKGFFSPRTGKITIVIPNHVSAYDAAQTLLHEAVAHYGLRQLFGEHFDTFLDNVYNHAEPEIRERIDALSRENGYSTRVATEEYLASLAETTEFEYADKTGWWQKIKELFLDMLRKIGFEDFSGVTLSDNELRYILWRSYENLREPGRYRTLLDTAADTRKQYELKVGNFRSEESSPSRVAESRSDVKAERIRKLRESRPMEITGKEIEPSDDLKQYKKNALEYGKKLQGSYVNKDTGRTIQLQRGRKNGGLKEVLQHDIGDAAHIQSVAAIPQIIENAIYMESERNNDPVKNPNVSQYHYYVCGLKIGSEDYTVRMVEAEEKDGNRYYDHKLSHIEKGKLLDELARLNFSSSTGLSSTPGTGAGERNRPTNRGEIQAAPISGVKDKRLLSILQTSGTSATVEAGEETDDDIRFRFADRPEIVQEYDHAVSTSGFRFQEAFQDSMLSFKLLQGIIERRSGLKVRSYEDAYTAENRLSSLNKQDNERYIEHFYQPLVDWVKVLADRYGRQKVEDYIYAKSGLERNEVFLRRDAQKSYDEGKAELDGKLAAGTINQDQYEVLMQQVQATYENTLAEGHDYAGLEGLAFRDHQERLDEQLASGEIDQLEYNRQEKEIKADYKHHAEELVRDFEAEATEDEVNQLWERINAATNETLAKGLRTGMLSKEKHEEIKNMMKYYVPMRGWEETIAEDVYDYTRREPAVQKPKSAKGRKSIADNPVAQIALAAQNAIILGNRNLMKQRFFNFLSNRPNELAVIANVWYAHTYNTVHGQVERVYPEIDEADDAETIRRKMDEFEKRMEEEQKEGRAYRGKVPLGMELKLKSGQKPEHMVSVMMNGKEYLIYINGDPRAAQAINGKTNPEDEENIFWQYYNQLKRLYGGGLTSNNPDFVAANLVRDTIHSATMTFLNEGFRASAHYVRNVPRSFTTVVRGIRGKYDPANPRDVWFQEFLAGGGETGYTAIHTLEDYKKEYDRALKEVRGMRRTFHAGQAGLDAVVKWLETANRIAEDVNRFNAYMSSRQVGKDVEESVNAAKSITVNFNKKGALGHGKGTWAALAWFMNKWILFFNPAVQGLYQVGQAARQHRARVVRTLGAIMASGFVMPYLNSLLIAAFGGDDDDDYFNQTDYTRMNNWLLYVGNGYLKIPLPPFFREVYGLGDILHRVVTGRLTPERASVATLRQVQSAVGFINLIPSGEPSVQEAVGGLMPDLISPLMDIAFNRDFTGRALAKDEEYTKNLPEYERIYKGVSPVYVEISRTLNELGGDEARRSPLWGTFINPAYMEHLVISYTGGIGKTISNLTGMGVDVAGGDWDNIEPRSIPVLNRFINPVTERTVASAINRVFYEYRDRYEAARVAEKRYRQFVKDGRSEFRKELEQMDENGELDFIRYFDRRMKTLRKLQNRLKDESGDRELERRIRELKAEMVTDAKELLE